MQTGVLGGLGLVDEVSGSKGQRDPKQLSGMEVLLQQKLLKLGAKGPHARRKEKGQRPVQGQQQPVGSVAGPGGVARGGSWGSLLGSVSRGPTSTILPVLVSCGCRNKMLCSLGGLNKEMHFPQSWRLAV